MKFPFVILRRSNLEKIHNRNRQLDKDNKTLNDENQSLKMVVKRQEQKIDLLKDKCSRVGISKLENEIVRLNEALSDTKLPQPDGTIPPVLPDALVQDTPIVAPDDLKYAERPHTGSLQKVLGLEVPGSHLA